MDRDVCLEKTETENLNPVCKKVRCVLCNCFL